MLMGNFGSGGRSSRNKKRGFCEIGELVGHEIFKTLTSFFYNGSVNE